MEKTLKLFFFLGLFFLLLLPAMDPDLGWQLRCGELILQGQGFCGQNQFSSLLADYFWPNHYWFYQATLFLVWQNFGFWGLSVLNALVVVLAFFIFDQTIANYHWEKKIAILLILFLSWGVFSLGIRSQLLGILFFVLLLYLFFKQKSRYLPLVFLVWANTHGSVVLGLCFFSLLAFKNLKKYWFILFCSFLMTLINPFVWQIYQEAWRHFQGAALDKLIAEWVPPGPSQYFLALISGLSLFFLAPRSFWPAIASLIFLALRARRNVPFFWLFFFVLFFQSKFIKKWLARWRKQISLRKDLLLLTSLLVFFYGLAVQPRQTFQANASWTNYCQASTVGYPCQAIEFLKKQPAANLFNRYEWGGFLIWQLPEYKVFVDGRMPAWPTSSGKSPYTIYLETLQTRSGWQEILDQHHIDWILISPGTFMDLKLQPDPEAFGWQEAYRDQISVVYKKMK